MDAQLRARLPSTVDEFLSAGQALVDSSKKFLDSMYTADAVSGISPVVAAARNRVFTQAILDGDARILAVTLLKSGGYTLTTKRLILSDKVAYAGGVAVQVEILTKHGVREYDKVYYKQSGWIPASFSSSSAPIALSNYDHDSVSSGGASDTGSVGGGSR